MTTAPGTDADAAAADPGAPPDERGAAFRLRLIEGLAVSIRERGYRDTTVADIVRHAHTSRRTFYAEFPSKDECYVALLYSTNQQIRQRIESSVDQGAPWRRQVRQAVQAYVDSVASEPEITLSWIRELPALGTLARTIQREAMDSLTELLLRLTDTEAFHRAGAGPFTRPAALLLLGGIRELTATIVEDGGDVRDLTEVATNAATAMLAPVSDHGDG
ncbi:MAG TPA: TetR/AcrR family transcriptional regulator [Actinocrinis sp.]|nr:TetR/AcrR family transcriptional regulator [Actinocrinis sp.]